MNELAQMIGLFVVLFGASMAAAWLLTTLKLGSRKCPEPKAGSALRMRGPNGMYRTRVVETRGPFWVLAAPLMRDFYVPMHIGEKLTVEYPMDGGVMFFRSTVRARDTATHTLIIDRPEGGRKTERRAEKRVADPTWAPGSVEGSECLLMNVSVGGARLSTSHRIQIGERVGVTLPWDSRPVFGWVLETVPVSNATLEARVRFEEPLSAVPG